MSPDSIKFPKYLLFLPGGELYIFLTSLMSDLVLGIDLANKMNTCALCHFQGTALRGSMFSTVISFPYAKRSTMFLRDAALTA